VAAWDADADVRREALWTLRGWAAEAGARGEKARAALRSVDEIRRHEESGRVLRRRKR
jgi:hypothetical protein